MPENPQKSSQAGDHINEAATEKSTLDSTVAQNAQKTESEDKGPDGRSVGKGKAQTSTSFDQRKKKLKRTRTKPKTKTETLLSETPMEELSEKQSEVGEGVREGAVPAPRPEQPDDILSTRAMEVLSLDNEFVRNALEMRRQIDQYMEPGPERDKIIHQLKSDVTSSLSEAKAKSETDLTDGEVQTKIDQTELERELDQKKSSED